MPRHTDDDMAVKAEPDAAKRWFAEVARPALEDGGWICLHRRKVRAEDVGLVCASHPSVGIFCRACFGLHLVKWSHPAATCTVCGAREATHYELIESGPVTGQHGALIFAGSIQFVGFRLCSSCVDPGAS